MLIGAVIISYISVPFVDSLLLMESMMQNDSGLSVATVALLLPSNQVLLPEIRIYTSTIH